MKTALKALLVAMLAAGVAAYGQEAKTAPTVVKEVQILKDESAIPYRGNKSLTFTAEAVPAGQIATIFFKGRAPGEIPSGYYGNALSVELNGKRVTADCFISHPRTAKMLDGRDIGFFGEDNLVTLAWAPDFTSADTDAGYAVKGVKVCEFEFKPGALLKTGENKLVFVNMTKEEAGKTYEMSIADVKLRMKTSK